MPVKVMELILNLNRCNSICNVETTTQQLISQHLTTLHTMLMKYTKQKICVSI